MTVRAAIAAGLLGLGLLAGCGEPDDRTAEELYPKYCARCHGKDGKGDPRNVNLYPNLDLTHSKLTGKGSRGILYRRIAQGYGPMPGFSHRLSTEEMERLVDYSLKLNQANAGK
ncbi:MAG TPA: cytochrome c [Thermoanaerobaculia bacterium]|nr:cytochrome c [Thermoanaerobaculia bacterium]